MFQKSVILNDSNFKIAVDQVKEFEANFGTTEIYKPFE
jgi:hypothetical protein